MSNIDVFKSHIQKNDLVNWSYRDILLIVIFLILFQFVYGFFLVVLGMSFFTEKNINLLVYISLTQFILYFCFFVWLVFYRYKISCESLGLIKKRLILQDILIAILSAVFLQCVFYTVSSFYPQIDGEDYLKYFDPNFVTPINIALSAIIIIFLMPIVEEIFFRGILFQKLRESFKAWVALVIQSFFFTITHIQYFFSYYIIYIFVLGLVTGWIYHRTNNLRTAIYLHSTYNLIWFLWFIYFIKG